jgi:formylglycine-generating enzyme required for sulfatase activity
MRRILPLLVQLITAAILLCAGAAGCVLEWSGERPGDAEPIHSDGPRADAARDAPAPDLDAGISGDRVDLPSPDAWAVPGTWVKLPPGSFSMGSPASETCRPGPDAGVQETPHLVTLTHGFKISTTEVTQRQFEAVMGYNLSYDDLKMADHPKEGLSWIEAVAYCTRLSIKEGYKPCYVKVPILIQCKLAYGCSDGAFCQQETTYCARYEDDPAYAGDKIYTCPGYRLPTEAEWEYAYRAGTISALHTTGALDPKACKTCSVPSPAADAIAWYLCNTNKRHRAVGTKLANSWQLHDMAGNVSEWCHDRFVNNLGAVPVTDPAGPAVGDERVVRGGDFTQYAGRVRAAARRSIVPTSYGNEIGFRCVRTILP